MSQPISPAIIINENFDARPELPTGYNVVVTGFTSEGIANEPFIISSITDFVSLFGEPDATRAEQIYAYDAVERVVRSGANAVFTKLPYGAGAGYDVGEDFSALVFPSLADTTELEEITGYISKEFLPASAFGSLSSISPFDNGVEIGEDLSVLDYNTAISAGFTIDVDSLSSFTDTTGYVFGEPVRVSLTEEDYDNIKCGQIDWSDEIQSFDTGISSYDPVEFGKAGLIVLDEGRSKSIDASEGYYISVADNTDGDPSTDWDAVKSIKTSTTTTGLNIWSDVPTERYDFKLTTPYTSATSSVSQSIASLASQKVNRPWENGEYKNWLNVTLWRLRKDVRNGSDQLVPSVVESHTGSVSNTETVLGEGGFNQNVFISDVVDGDSRRLDVIINPNISEDSYVDNTGQKVKNVRMWREGLVGLQSPFPPLGTFTGTADALYSVSKYTPKVVVSACDVGNIPKKLKSALCTIDNPDRVDIDLSIEAGLGTIWATVKTDPDSWLTGDPRSESFCYSDCTYLDIKGDLGRSVPEGTEKGNLRGLWMEVFECFHEFTEQVRICNGGNHHLHIADPIRQILVNGCDCKVYSSKTKCKNSGIFADMIYHPLKNLTKLTNTSLATIDAQWYKTNNIYTPKPVWVPSSGVLASLFAETPFPWDAAAGVQRGRINGVLDVAIDPVQRDRDLLWKIHANASFFDRSTDGILRFADQTLLKNDNIQLRQNSARRLMVWLEKNLRIALRPFLFEPNNLQTRIRFKNEIELYLKTLLENGAVEDYAVSLSRNTATAQQEGCLIADIAIKITGQVDKITLNFNILRLDQPFQEVF